MIRKARIKPWAADNKKIGQMMARLYDFAMSLGEFAEPPPLPLEEGETPPPPVQRVLTGDQLKAYKLYLSKTLPDLKAIEHSGNEDKPVVHRVEREIIDHIKN